MSRPSRIIVLGTSAGGVEALKQLVRDLPAEFPAALLAVMHVPARVPSLLASILDRCGPLPVAEAVDGRPIEAGHIYVGVPDRHLLVDGGVMRLTCGPKEHRFRPAIDTLFRSAACTAGSRVVGVVLTGQLDDGASGLWAIKDRGGVAVVQSPGDAQYPSMPMHAVQHVEVDHVVDLAAMPGLLMQLAQQPIEPAEPQKTHQETHQQTHQETFQMRAETEFAAGGGSRAHGPELIGKSSRLTCGHDEGTTAPTPSEIDAEPAARR